MTIPYQYAGKIILVTGGSGFIGSRLCRHLCAEGAKVHAISRVSHPSGENGVRWLQCDLADMRSIQNIVTAVKPDVIFHLASQVVGTRDRSVIIPTFHSNLLSTVHLLLAASELTWSRIVLSSSLEEPAQGDAETAPSSPYAAAKWASSAYARMFYALYELPVVILRLFMVFGPAQRDLHKLVPYAILSLLRGETPRFTSGERQVDWVYVDDVVAALLAAGQAQAVAGSTIDIGTGQLISISAVVQKIFNLMKASAEPVFGALPDRPLEQVRVANIAHTFSKLEWRPTTSLDEGLKRTVDWYTQQFNAGLVR